MLQHITRHRLLVSRYLLISAHIAALVAVLGFSFPDFLRLTPFNLLMSIGLLLWNHRHPDSRLWRFLVIAWLTGFWVEVAGVATGRIFGIYEYDYLLGFKWLDVPLMIGVNWAMVVYLGNDIANRIASPTRPLMLRAALGALLPTLFDVLVEPVAIRYGMWHWSTPMPPLQNYIAWFVVAFFLSLVFQTHVPPNHRNPVALLLFGLQVGFFIALNLF